MYYHQRNIEYISALDVREVGTKKKLIASK